MQKVYLLLRNNTETGPHTLEELLALLPHPRDLVWIEGKSGSWAYPHEISELKAYVPAPPPAQPSGDAGSRSSEAAASARHIFVSLPANARKATSRQAPEPDLDERADALRRRVQEQPAATDAAASPEPQPQTNYTRSLYDAEDAYTRWLYEKKTRRRPGLRKYLLITGVAAALFTGGLFAGQWLRQGNNSGAPVLQTPDPTAIPAVRHEPISPEENSQNPVFTPADTLPQAIGPGNSAVAKPKAAKTPTEAPQNTVTEQEPAAVVQQTEAAITPTATASEPIVETPAPDDSRRKKQGLFGGLFRKKDKDEAKEPAPNSNDGNRSERKVRRREGTAQTSPVPVDAAKIELRPSSTGENWMLGVNGQKLTLVNHGAEPLQSATVEVWYLTEGESILEKRTLSFTNIAAKGQATAAVPNHRTAEKLSFKLVSAQRAATSGQ